MYVCTDECLYSTRYSAVSARLEPESNIVWQMGMKVYFNFLQGVCSDLFTHLLASSFGPALTELDDLDFFLLSSLN